MSKNENNILSPLVDSLCGVLAVSWKSGSNIVCNQLGIKTERQKVEEKQKIEEMLRLREQEEIKQRELEVESKNTLVIGDKKLNFNDLFFNCGLKNKLKDTPTLENIKNYKTADIYSFKLPTGVTLSTVQNKIEEISDFFEVPQMNIKLQKKNGLMDIIITKDNVFNKVFEYKDYGLSENLKIPVGHFINQDYMEKMLVIDMSKDEIPHGFIGSSTGGGKSNFIRVMLLNWILNKKPEDIEIVLIDGKGGAEYSPFLSAPHIVENKCYNDEGDIEITLDRAINEILRRNQLFISKGVNNYKEYTETNKLPRRVIIFDEYAMYHGSNVYKIFQSKVGKICSTGRTAGVHIIVATQDGRREILDSMIKYNMPLKIGFKCDNPQHSINISGFEGLETINRIGVGRVFGLPMDTDYVQFKTMKAPSSREIKRMIERKYSGYNKSKNSNECDSLEGNILFGEECED